MGFNNGNQEDRHAQLRWPLYLHVQLLHRNKEVYRKKLVVAKNSHFFLGTDSNNKTFFFPAHDGSQKPFEFLDFNPNSIQLHIQPSWDGFYIVENRTANLTNQKESIQTPADSCGCFFEGEYGLNWKISQNDDANIAPQADGSFFRMIYDSALEIQNTAIALVMMIIITSIIGITVSRLQIPNGFLASLTKSQLLSLIDKELIYTAPEYIDNLDDENILPSILKYFSEYNQSLSQSTPELGQRLKFSFPHHTQSNLAFNEMRNQVLRSNNLNAETSLIIPTIVGETQTTSLWRLFEKISFIQNSSKVLLNERLKINRDLTREAAYDYASPENTAKVKRKPVVIPDEYLFAGKIAGQSMRREKDEERLFSELHHQAEAFSPVNLRADFKLARFALPNTLNKLSQLQDGNTDQKN